MYAFKRYVALVLFAAVFSTNAGAASIQFINFIDQDGNPALMSHVVTIDNNTAGQFNILVEQQAGADIGDITGVFFDLSDSLNAGNASITGITGAIQSVGFDTNNLGGGVNLTPIPAFHVGVKYAGLTTDDLQTVKFSVSDLAGTLDLDDFTRIGIRNQSVGTLGGSRGNSTKDVSTTIRIVPEEPGPTVPLPASAWTGLTLLAGLGAHRYRRMRAA